MNARALTVAMLLVPPGALIPALVLAVDREIVHRACIEEALIVKDIPVPVGCRLVDCCPGCPTSAPLEWRVKVDGRALRGAELRFDGLDAAEVRRLQVSGSARIQGERIVLSPGRSTIRGIPRQVGGKTAVGSLMPVARTAAMQPARHGASRGAPSGRQALTDSITVGQYLGAVPVNDFRWRRIVTQCVPGRTAFRVPWDTLKVQGHAADERFAVLIDARTQAGATGCHDGSNGNEWGITATPGANGNIQLPNLLSAQGCNSEIAIFSRNHKMHFEQNVTRWTNPSGDVHPVPLEPPISVPLTVWIADGAAAARAVDEVNNANLLYRQNRVGIQLVPRYEDKSGDPAAVGIINNGLTMDPVTGRKECMDLQGLKDNGLYADKALNIYYIAMEMEGRNCAIRKTPTTPCPSAGAPRGDGNITYVGSIPNLVVVAHELGHAFGLRPGPCHGHTGGGGTYVPGFDADNIMLGDAAGLESHFSLGQVFRMNTHHDEWGGTMLIENGFRPATDRRACMPNSAPGTYCPLLRTDLP